MPIKPISPYTGYELSASLEDLVPNCFAEWDVVKEEGFAYFDKLLIPIGLGNITIRDVREDFLGELAQFDNDTLSEDIPLTIPRKGAYPNWNGLESDVDYKFRLSTTCPGLVNDDNPNDRKNVTTYTDVVISTNAPPNGQPLEIEPSEGEALRTIFRFTVGIASDLTVDYPLKYMFGYIADGYVVYLTDFYESTVTRIDFPYSGNNINNAFY